MVNIEDGKVNGLSPLYMRVMQNHQVKTLQVAPNYFYVSLGNSAPQDSSQNGDTFN